MTFIVLEELLRNKVAGHSPWEGWLNGCLWLTKGDPNVLGDGFPHWFYLGLSPGAECEGEAVFLCGCFFLPLTSLSKYFWFQSRLFFSATFKQLVCEMTFYIFSEVKLEPLG